MAYYGVNYHCKECSDCTADKTRMRVKDFHKAQFMVKFHVTSKEEYDVLINELTSSLSYLSKNNFDALYHNFMDDTCITHRYDDPFHEILYEFLRDKYGMTNESVEEAIKDEWYRRRSGCFTKSAIK